VAYRRRTPIIINSLYRCETCDSGGFLIYQRDTDLHLIIVCKLCKAKREYEEVEK
jgi:hypothetical protein